MTVRLKLLCFLSMLVICLNASADKTEEAAAHFQKGVDLFKENKKEAAVLEFKTAFRLKPSWKIMYNIGQCEASLRRYGMAIEAFEAYLGEGGDEVSEARRDEVLKELDRLRKMVGSVRVQGPPGYDILVDKIKRGETPMSSSIMVTAGVEHRISVVKGDREILDVAEKVSGGETLELTAVEANEPASAVEVTSETEPPPSPTQDAVTEADQTPEGIPSATEAKTDDKPAPPPAVRKKPFSPIVFFVSAGATVLFGGTTAGLAIAINNKWESSEEKIYDDPWAVNASAVSDNIRTMQLVSWGTLGLTAAGLIMTAVALPLTDWSAVRSDTATVTVTPFGGRDGHGLSIGGRF